MTIGIVAKLRCKEGTNAEYEAAFKGLQQAVSENEPGCLLYALHKSRSDPNVYYVMEQYKDDDALSQHAQSDAFKAAGVKLGPLVDGRGEVEVMDLVE